MGAVVDIFPLHGAQLPTGDDLMWSLYLSDGDDHCVTLAGLPVELLLSLFWESVSSPSPCYETHPVQLTVDYLGQDGDQQHLGMLYNS